MRRNVDPVLLEVLRNGFDTIADEIALIVMRTAYSAIRARLHGLLDRHLRRARGDAGPGPDDSPASRQLPRRHAAPAARVRGQDRTRRRVHRKRPVHRLGTAPSRHLHHEADLHRRPAARLGDDGRAPCRRRGDHRRQQLDRGDRDLPGGSQTALSQAPRTGKAQRGDLADRGEQRPRPGPGPRRHPGPDRGLRGRRARIPSPVQPPRGRDHGALQRRASGLRRGAGARGVRGDPRRHLRVHGPHRRTRRGAGDDRPARRRDRTG